MLPGRHAACAGLPLGRGGAPTCVCDALKAENAKLRNAVGGVAEVLQTVARASDPLVLPNSLSYTQYIWLPKLYGVVAHVTSSCLPAPRAPTSV
jgi:hypothetical protein